MMTPTEGRSEGDAERPVEAATSDDDTKGYDWPEDKEVPEDWVRCGDGLIYRRRIVAGVTAIVGTASPHPGSLRRAERIEAAIHSAIMRAVSEGVLVGSPELTTVIDAARDAAMNE